MVDPDEIMVLRALEALGDDLSGAAAVAVAGLEHARSSGENVIVPLGTQEAARAAFDTAARIARWLPTVPLPPGDQEGPHDRAHR